jgi:hypothetical protein
MFVTSLTWQLDYYRGDGGVARGLLNGWSISPIVTLRSGQPFTVLNGADANQDGVNSDRAQLVPGVNPVLDPHSAQFNSLGTRVSFNPAAFQRNPATAGVVQDGNSPRNFLDGPGYRNVDLAVFRDFKLRERFALQARLEASNAFNMVSLDQPNATASTSPSTIATTTGFGTITRAKPMRQLQLGLRLTF